MDDVPENLDVLRQGLRTVDQVTVGIGSHPAKAPIFDAATRRKMFEESVRETFAAADAERVDIVAFDGLAVDAARAYGASLILRGIRDGSDFDDEARMAAMNAQLAPDIQTLFVIASLEVRHISATLVRQIAEMGGDAAPFVPRAVVPFLHRRDVQVQQSVGFRF